HADERPHPGPGAVGGGGGGGVARRGAQEGAGAGLERPRHRQRHPAVGRRPGRVGALALEVDTDPRARRLGQPRSREERRVALQQRQVGGRVADREELAVAPEDARPGPAHDVASWASTRRSTVGAATTARRSISARAARRFRSTASCVIITTGTAAAPPRPFWITVAIEMSYRPRMPATCESTPGRSCAVTRR